MASFCKWLCHLRTVIKRLYLFIRIKFVHRLAKPVEPAQACRFFLRYRPTPRLHKNHRFGQTGQGKRRLSGTNTDEMRRDKRTVGTCVQANFTIRPARSRKAMTGFFDELQRKVAAEKQSCQYSGGQHKSMNAFQAKHTFFKSCHASIKRGGSSYKQALE